nr:InlB B-repeat-containing protein [Maliibacterium massiliense]
MQKRRTSKSILALMLTVMFLLNCLGIPTAVMAGDKSEVSPNVNQEQRVNNDAGDPVEQHSVTFLDWDGSQIIVQQVAHGQAATAPAHPGREGFEPDGWDVPFHKVESDLTVTAKYKALATFTITINYFYTDSQRVAAQPYVATVKANAPFKADVVSPAVLGFVPDQANVNFNLASVTGDITRTVYYSASGTTVYTVKHFKQKLDGEYELAATENLSGTTGSVATAVAKEYAGFQPKALPSAEIAADGQTVLEVYYERGTYVIYYETGGGTYIEPTAQLFEGSLTKPADPTRAGYNFAGWYLDKGLTQRLDTFPATMPVDGATYYAKWQAKRSVGYTVLYWKQNVEGTGYDYADAQTKYAAADTRVSGANDKNYSGFAFNSSLSDKNVSVKGDGSTIINVYYDRKVNTVTFKTWKRSGWSGSWVTLKTVSARYGEDIKKHWPDEYRWYDNSSTSGGWYASLDYMPAESITLYGEELGGRYRHVMNYCFEVLDENSPYDVTRNGKRYKIENVITFNDSTTWGVSDEDCYEYPGFTYESRRSFDWDWEQDHWEGTAYFYYDRNTYNISFYNNGSVTEKGPFRFQQDISKENYTPANPYPEIPGYTFDGWYTTAEGYEGTKFNWTNAKMPAGLQLYAKWIAPTYTVSFDLAGGEGSIPAQTVSIDGTIAEPKEPTRAGYDFAGWYKEGSNVHYVFDQRVRASFTLYAKWTPSSEISYTVKYVDASGKDLAPAKVVEGQTMASTVTETAQVVEKDGVAYLPDTLTKSLTLGAQDNVITFVYKPFNNVDYTINYIILDANGSEASRTSETRNTARAVETVSYKHIAGYVPDAYQKTIQLSAKASENVVNFYYKQNEARSYRVYHYTQKLGGGYALAQQQSGLSAPIGATVSATPLNLSGFTYAPQISIASGIIASSGVLELKLYYTRNSYDYTVRYLEQGTNKELHKPFKADAPFETQVTATAVGINGYNVVGSETQDISIGLGENVATFYYTKRADLSYTVNYLEQGTDKPLKQAKTVGNQVFGASVTEDGPATITDANGKVYNRVGDASQSITIATSGNEINFYYTEQQYGVTYLPNGGTGEAPADADTYKQGAQVSLLGKGSLVRDKAVFLGWSTQAYKLFTTKPAPSVVIYAAGQQLPMPKDGLTLYAVWAIDENGPGGGPDEVPDYEEYSVTYKAGFNGANGQEQTFSDGKLYPANYNYTVAASMFTRDHYTFNGWKDDLGATVRESASYTINGDVVLTAQWNAVAYNITYAGLEDSSFADQNPNPASYTIASDAITLQNPTRYGYTFLGWTGTGLTGASKNVTIPTGSTGDRAYTATWEEDHSVTKTLTYRVEHWLEGETTARAAQDIPVDIWVGASTYSVQSVAQNTYAGYDFKDYTINGTAVTLPVDVAEGTVIKVNYSTDDTDTKQLTYRVEHWLEGETTARAAQDIPVSIWAGTDVYNVQSVAQNTYAGYDFANYTINDAPVTFPRNVADGTVIKVNYTIDDTDTKEITYRVEHWLEGETTARAAQDIPVSIWAGTDVYSVTSVAQNTYAGYDFANYTINDAPVTFPRNVTDGTVIKVNYTIDDTDTKEITYRVEHWLEGETTARAAQDIPVSIWAGTDVYSVTSVAQNTYAGYDFANYTINDTPVTFPRNVTDGTVIKVNYTIDDTDTKQLTYRVEHWLEGETTARAAQDIPVSIWAGTDVYSVTSVAQNTYAGYDFANYTINDAPVTFPRNVADGTVIKVNYTIDDTDTKQLTYRVEHWLEGETTARAAQDIPVSIWAGTDVYSVQSVAQNTYAGYDFANYTINDAPVTFPRDVADGTVIKVNYTIDETDTKEITYRVEHWLEGETTARAAQDIPVDIWAGTDVYNVQSVAQNTYAGYDFANYTINDTPVTFPRDVADGTVIKVNYTIDDTDTKEITYRVEHWLEGETTARAAQDIPVNIWAGTDVYSVQSVAQNTYAGYDFANYTINDASVTFPRDVADGTVIRVNYTIDDTDVTALTYSVEHWVEGETAARDIVPVTVDIWAGADSYVVDSVTLNSYEGFTFSSYSVSLPATVRGGDVIRVDYAASTQELPPVVPPAPIAPPVTPVGPITPAAPVVPEPEAPAPETPVEIPEPSVPAASPSPSQPVVEIPDVQTPLANKAVWALLNLLLAIACGIVMLVLLVGYFVGKKKKQDAQDEANAQAASEAETEEELKRKGVWRLLSIIPGIGALIVFFLTENMRNPMAFTDKWTLLMVIIAVVQLVITILAFKRRKKNDGAQDANA